MFLLVFFLGGDWKWHHGLFGGFFFHEFMGLFFFRMIIWDWFVFVHVFF